jgi:RNA polymerase sigma factor (sigma-70 family)
VAGDAVAVPQAGEAVQPPAALAERLFDAHQARLYRLARRLAASPDDARDLVQETFLRVARSPRAVPAGERNEEAWLVRVLVNVCRDEWRRGATRRRYARDRAVEAGETRQRTAEDAFVARCNQHNKCNSNHNKPAGHQVFTFQYPSNEKKDTYH